MTELKMMDKQKKQTENIAEKLARGMEIAVEKCLLDKIVKGQTVVYAHDDGSIYTMSAKEDRRFSAVLLFCNNSLGVRVVSRYRYLV